MKTTAPEKIYITPHFERRWFTKEIDDVSIEYTRTDAFIEKAAEWMKLYVLNHDMIDIFEMEDDFKKNMKGE